MAALHRNWSVKHRNDLIRELRLNPLALRTLGTGRSAGFRLVGGT
jgi:hypothetical protein